MKPVTVGVFGASVECTITVISEQPSKQASEDVVSRVVPARLMNAINLILDDATDAIAAETMYRAFVNHHENLATQPPEKQRVWYYIDQSIGWRLALTVNRQLQPPRKDLASVSGLVREIKQAVAEGYALPDAELFASAEAELARLRALPEALEVKRCRDEFMAHTVLDGDRKGMQLEIVCELQGAIEQVIEDLFRAVTGQQSPLLDRYAQWREWSDLWWRDRFPEADEDAGLR